MTDQQLVLVPQGTRCGYCDRELVRRGPILECARCVPLLRVVATIADYARFQREAHGS